MCFSLEWIRDILIWLVVICGVVAFVKLVIPRLGLTDPLVLGAVNILVWVLVAVAVIVVFFAVISCATSGFHLGRLN